MNSKILCILGLPVMLSLTACGKSKDEGNSEGAGAANISTDSNGNCSTQFVYDYNNVILETNSAARVIDSQYYTEAEKIGKLQTVQNACKKFLSTHPNVSCKAEVNYEKKQVSSNDVKQQCDVVDSILAEKNKSSQPVAVTPAPETKPAPAPVAPETPITRTDDTVLVQDLRNDQIELTVLNAEVLREAFVTYEKVENGLSDQDALNQLVISNGALTSIENLFRNSGPWKKEVYCFSFGLEATASKMSFKTGLAYTVMEKAEESFKNQAIEGRVVVLVLDKLDIAMNCTRQGGNKDTPISLGEVRQALKGVMEVTIKK